MAQPSSLKYRAMDRHWLITIEVIMGLFPFLVLCLLVPIAPSWPFARAATSWPPRYIGAETSDPRDDALTA